MNIIGHRKIYLGISLGLAVGAILAVIILGFRQGIDFISLADEIFDVKIEWLVADEVIEELRMLSMRKESKGKEKEAAKLGLELLERLDAERIRLKNPNVDDGIVAYSQNHDVVVASLDKGLKKRIKGKIMTIQGKNRINIV